MARIQFDRKYRPQIESGEYKVETRDGRLVRIVCWDRNGDYPIMALATEANGHESYISYLSNGRMTFHNQEFPTDLFIVTPEPKLTEFEERLVKFYNDCKGLPRDKDGVCNRHDLDELLHNTAAELLAMARKQLQPEMYAKFEKIYENADKIAYENGMLFGKTETKEAYEQGYDAGKKDALKGLPRRKKIGRGNNYSAETKFTINGRYLEINDTLNDVYEVPLSDLEKLPGFKED